ncbi:MAG: 4Fe-4S binding protein, partial [Methylotetracoccus sp.]|nr:4Fe-4S binding protein [Methylotetracoccus sp.]
QELEWVRCLLTAVGFGPEALRRVSAEELRKTIIRVRPHQPIEPLTDWNEDAGKRAWIRSAVNHLRPATSSAPFVLLPAGAPFGAVQVDPQACTLCMKCVPVCPESVLTGNSDRGELALIEESCIQCGGCVRTCPERAVTLLPRYTFIERARQEAQLLLSRDRVCDAQAG